MLKANKDQHINKSFKKKKPLKCPSLRSGHVQISLRKAFNSVICVILWATPVPGIQKIQIQIPPLLQSFHEICSVTLYLSSLSKKNVTSSFLLPFFILSKNKTKSGHVLYYISTIHHIVSQDPKHQCRRNYSCFLEQESWSHMSLTIFTHCKSQPDACYWVTMVRIESGTSDFKKH